MKGRERVIGFVLEGRTMQGHIRHSKYITIQSQNG